MKRTLLLLLALPLSGCMIPAGMAATAWVGVKTVVKIARVVEFVWPDGDELEPEEEPEDDESRRSRDDYDPN